MSRMRRLVLMISVGGVIASAPGFMGTQNVEVRVALEKSVITQHEPTVLRITIVNSSSSEVEFDPGYDKERIELSVTSPAGTRWRRRRAASTEGMKFSNSLRIPPGTTGSMALLLNEWFSFDMLGSYQVDVALSPRAGSYLGKTEHTNLVLTVLPRDEVQLESACATLVKEIRDLQSASTAMIAAEALSKVDDPVAVPYLAQAMDRREFVGLMIEALARLKTDKALEVLTAASRSNDPETSTLARSALAGMGVK
jgi:hypothetical protein